MAHDTNNILNFLFVVSNVDDDKYRNENKMGGIQLNTRMFDITCNYTI